MTVASELVVGLLRVLVEEQTFTSEAKKQVCRDALTALADHLGVVDVDPWPAVVDNALHGTLDAVLPDIDSLPTPVPTAVVEP